MEKRDATEALMVMRSMMAKRMQEVGEDEGRYSLQELPLRLSYKQLLDEETDEWAYVTVEFGVNKEADHAAA